MRLLFILTVLSTFSVINASSSDDTINKSNPLKLTVTNKTYSQNMADNRPETINIANTPDSQSMSIDRDQYQVDRPLSPVDTNQVVTDEHQYSEESRYFSNESSLSPKASIDHSPNKRTVIDTVLPTMNTALSQVLGRQNGHSLEKLENFFGSPLAGYLPDDDHSDDNHLEVALSPYKSASLNFLKYSLPDNTLSNATDQLGPPPQNFSESNCRSSQKNCNDYTYMCLLYGFCCPCSVSIWLAKKACFPASKVLPAPTSD